MNEVVKNTLLACVIVFVFLFLIKFLDVSYPLTITNMSKSAELSVVGEGKIDVVPDKAVVNVGITVQDVANVAEAQKMINETKARPSGSSGGNHVVVMAGNNQKKTEYIFKFATSFSVQ